MKTLLMVSLGALPLLGLYGASAQSVPPWTLTATRDSFIINVNGQQMGFAVLAVERLPKGFRITESTRIGTMIEQTTEVLLDLEQRMISVLQTGRMRGQEARIELRYGDKRVTGSATLPGASGPQSHNVDSAVPDDVLDDNVLQAVLAALPWSENAAYTLPVFSGGKNALKSVTLTVVGTAAIAIPAGNTAAYKVEMRGGEAPVDFYVSKASPHRVLKVAPVGAPFEMLRAN